MVVVQTGRKKYQIRCHMTKMTHPNSEGKEWLVEFERRFTNPINEPSENGFIEDVFVTSVIQGFWKITAPNLVAFISKVESNAVNRFKERVKGMRKEQITEDMPPMTYAYNSAIDDVINLE